MSAAGRSKPVAAGTARPRGHKARGHQVCEHVGDEPDRILHLLGDPAPAQRRRIRVRVCQRQHRPDRIIAPARQLQPHRPGATSYPVSSTYASPPTAAPPRVARTTCEPSQYTTPVVARVSSSWAATVGVRSMTSASPGIVIRQPAG